MKLYIVLQSKVEGWLCCAMLSAFGTFAQRPLCYKPIKIEEMKSVVKKTSMDALLNYRLIASLESEIILPGNTIDDINISRKENDFINYILLRTWAIKLSDNHVLKNKRMIFA